MDGDTVAVCGFDDEAGGGHGGEALIESGGADAEARSSENGVACSLCASAAVMR